MKIQCYLTWLIFSFKMGNSVQKNCNSHLKQRNKEEEAVGVPPELLEQEEGEEGEQVVLGGRDGVRHIFDRLRPVDKDHSILLRLQGLRQGVARPSIVVFFWKNEDSSTSGQTASIQDHKDLKFRTLFD